MPITDTQIEAAYEVARQVHDGVLTANTGITGLHEQHELNPNSARDFINCYRHMCEGTLYKRGLSAKAISHYLCEISKQSTPALENAISSVKQYIAYRNQPFQSLTAIVEKYQTIIRPTLNDFEKTFESEVQKSFKDNPEQRQKRLESAKKLPTQTTVTVRVFNRNTDVVAEVLLRAKGMCEHCKQPAPFKKRDGSPYLEVHHKEQLAQGGEDTIDNAIALCPNCHRFLHHGKNEIKGELREGWAADSARIAANENDDEALGFT